MLSIGVTQERRGGAVDMHGAGAAQRHAAAELRAGHAEHVAQHPEQRRVAVDIDAVCSPVDFDGEGHGAPSFLSMAINSRPATHRLLSTFDLQGA